MNLQDVELLALSLPETEEQAVGANRAWRVRQKLFVWERPLRPRDREELGEAVPQGIVLAARVENEAAKRALIESEPDVFFTTSHFDRSPVVLVRLDEIGEELLEEVVTEAWLNRAPPHLARAWQRLNGHPD